MKFDFQINNNKSHAVFWTCLYQKIIPSLPGIQTELGTSDFVWKSYRDGMLSGTPRGGWGAVMG